MENSAGAKCFRCCFYRGFKLETYVKTVGFCTDPGFCSYIIHTCFTNGMYCNFKRQPGNRRADDIYSGSGVG